MTVQLPRSALKPKDVGPSELVAMLLSEGVVDHEVVDFPRRRSDGTAIAKVHVRLLSDEEQALAVAGAVVEMQRLLQQGEARQHPQLEWNLTVRHLLSFACRDARDPRERFFRGGPVEVAQFTDRELAELWVCYVAVKERSLPSLGEMTDGEMVDWANRVEEGVKEEFPFYLASQASAQGFFTSAARCVAGLARENAELRAELERLATSATGDGTSGTTSSGASAGEST